MSTSFDDFVVEQLKDSEFRSEYEALQPAYAAVQATIDARKVAEAAQRNFQGEPELK